MRVKTYEEAVTLINDNPYGNGTAIFTRDGGAARQFQFEVNAGHGRHQRADPVPVAFYSFGGWKDSLFGDLHMYGPEGIQFYTRSKIVTSRWPDPGTSKIDLGFPRTRWARAARRRRALSRRKPGPGLGRRRRHWATLLVRTATAPRSETDDRLPKS